MKYGQLTLGQIEAMVNTRGGMEGVERFLRGEMVVKLAERAFPVWKTIKLGNMGGMKIAADDFRVALTIGGFRIGDWANDLLGRPAFKTEAKEREVDLVVVSVAELGFPNGATRKDIYRRAKELGLELCPAEVGPQQLRLQYKDQPMNEWLLIGMEPITGSDGSPNVFGVAHGGDGSWLDSGYGRPGRLWHGSDRWVFVRGK